MAIIDEKLRFVVLRFDDSIRFDSYLLLSVGEEATYRPVLANGRIVVVADYRLLPRALEIADVSMRSLGTVPDDVSLIIDISEAIDIVERGSGANLGYLLSFINIYLDLLKAVGIQPPDRRIWVLTELAQWVFSGKPVCELYELGSVTAEECLDAVYWLLGAVSSRMRIFDEDCFGYFINGESPDEEEE